VTGGCLCGAVRFAVDQPLQRAFYCHCTRCQRRTGTAASASGTVVPGSFRFLQGEAKVRAFDPGGGGFLKAFCGECGAHLYAQSPDDPDVKSVRLGAFDDDPGTRPAYRQFTAYAASWEPIPDDGLPRHPERLPT
jgi:hypothetical protein